MNSFTLDAAHARIAGEWCRSVRLQADKTGRLTRVETIPEAGNTAVRGFVLPGIANLHSHAFQRAMAGRAERKSHTEDSFWTWRELMYAFATRMTPEHLQAVAAQLYVEMLKAGYTSVCEFHYLHHAPDGSPYSDPGVMSQAIVAAAKETGIGLTLLPVLYLCGGFDGRPLQARQRRFAHSVDTFLELLETLLAWENANTRVGLAFHSLRAVPEQAMCAVLDNLTREYPIHIHVAEQVGEVQDCLAMRGARPVQWLLDHAPVDAHWTLVHATHLDKNEITRLAASGATVALCPSTEANLGDGLFPLREFLAAKGHWGIGSDSHVSVSPVEELRWLEYGQRLRWQQRNIAIIRSLRTGDDLVESSLATASDATGRAVGRIEPGARADLVVLDEQAPELAGCQPENVLDAWIFAGNRPLVRDVYVSGRQVVAAGRHIDEERIAARYTQAVAELLKA